MKINWKELDPLPPSVTGSVQKGVAGPYAGLHGNTLIIAGGANFGDLMPWHGGEKYYHNEVYGMIISDEGGCWIKQGPLDSLDIRVAYGTSVSTPYGVVCMGGETENGLTDTVFMISIAGEKMSFTSLPSLPLPLSNAASAVSGSKIFIAGGTSGKGITSGLWCLDLDSLGNGWQSLSDTPLALANSVMTSTGGETPCLWLLGGRTRAEGDDTSEIRSEVFKYMILEDQWSHEGVISVGADTFKLAAGTGAALDESNLILFGGNDGSVFNRVEKLLSEMAREKDTSVVQEERNRYISLQETHPGFSRSVLLYNIPTKKWIHAGEIPDYTQVTTISVNTPVGIVIPSGEIRPGIRTPKVMLAVPVK